MSESKIQIKVGIVEFSGEGEQEWLAAQLDKILEKIPELLKIEISTGGSQNNKDLEVDNAGTTPGLSLINIAGKLNSKSGTDLIMAAAAYLHFIEKKPSFSRDEISQTMKKAAGYYKTSHMANLTANLTSLEKTNLLTKSSPNNYSINIDKVKELNAALYK